MKLKFDPDNPEFEYIIEEKALDKALAELEKVQIIGVDVETSGLDPYFSKLLLVQVGSEKKSYIIDARKIELGKIERFKTLLQNPSVLKLLHNAKFDYAHIKVHTGIELTNIYDTMISEGILTAGVGRKFHSLKNLSKDYLEINLDKGTQKTFVGHRGKITEEQLKYAANDILVLFPIFHQQVKKLKKEGLLNIAKLEFAVTRVVAEMELRGLYIDIERWKEILSRLKVKRDDYANKFQEEIRQYYSVSQVGLFGGMADSININSQVQLMDLFNNRLGLDIPSTGDGILASVQHPIAQMLRDYRGYEKLLSSFGESLLEKVNKKTGRIHPDFMQMGTATGRFACANPNLQQIPRNSEETPFRECFVPAEGYKLVVADYSSMEMRVLADLSGDKKMIRALSEGLDIHSYTASLMFGKPYSNDFKKKFPELRQIAKPIGFGLMYGMGPMGLAGQIKVSKEEARDYMDKYFKSYPSVKKFLDNMANSAVKKGWSATPAGRKRWYKKPDPDDPDYKRLIAKIQREAKNHPIQGTNADVTKYALVFIHERLKKEGIEGYITHTVHDEIVCEVREDQAQDWGKIHEEEMQRAGELFIKRVPVKVDSFIGDVWEH